MKRVGVLVHPTRPVTDAVEAVRGWAEEHGLELVQVPIGDQPEVAPPGDVSACDVIVALGGDGTVLKALHAAARTGTPVLGIAYGSLGALAAVPQSELCAGLDRVAAGAYSSQHLPALALASADEDLGFAVNDVVVSRRGGTQLIVDVYVEEQLYVRVAGDGVVIATPLGSSAYSMAAGGSLLATGVDAFVCTPLAMHGGCAPPLVVPQDRAIRLDIRPLHGGAGVQIDGFEVRTGDARLTIASHLDYTKLVQLDESPGGLARLRERGLISDSPRAIADTERALHARR